MPLFATFSFTVMNSDPSKSVTHGAGSLHIAACALLLKAALWLSHAKTCTRAGCLVHHCMTWCLHPGFERFHFTETKRTKGLNDIMLLSALASPKAGFIDQDGHCLIQLHITMDKVHTLLACTMPSLEPCRHPDACGSPSCMCKSVHTDQSMPLLLPNPAAKSCKTAVHTLSSARKEHGRVGLYSQQQRCQAFPC